MGTIQKFQNAIQGSRAIDKLQGAVDWVSQAKGSIQGWAGTAYTVASNGSTFIGMNYEQMPTIREAIRTYVKTIQTTADKLNTDADANTAIHGDATEATKAYIRAIKEITDAYVSSLLIYSDKMKEYYDAYALHDKTLSSNISDEAKSLSSDAQRSFYTEQK